ncbi:MAG: DUF4113 domain-containing protein [Dechloromonas sp.]|nr:DUF4113 domain-containing protein [Candidatus Dechloromonas phosphoritropha]
MNILPRANQHFSLFAPASMMTGRRDNLMSTLDGINQRYGRGTIPPGRRGCREDVTDAQRQSVSRMLTTVSRHA